MRFASSLMILAALLLGVAVGLGAYTFAYAKGYAYLTNDPQACTNCHVMQSQYDGWMKSSHHSAATCNDCHTPHNIIGKYAVKRSEEHTSELQSRFDLVCRLLLEKKKKPQ